MSKEIVKKMFAKIETATDMKKSFTELLKQDPKASHDALAEKIVDFGKASGFAFSKADLDAARAEVLENANGNKELSDNDLASVAGGNALIGSKAGNIVASVMSAGIICASISLASATKGDNCAGDLSQKVESYDSYCSR